MVANAGGPPAGTFASTDLDGYRQALDLNLLSSIALCQAAVPAMQLQGWGRVVAITSIGVRQPPLHLMASATARAGLTAFLKVLATEVSPRQKGYLMHHINGTYLQDEHPDSVEMDRRKWTQTYSAARKNIMKATNGIDLNIPYADQLQRLRPALADKLKFRGEYLPPAEWAEHVFSRQSVPKLNALLDLYEELVLTDLENLPDGPVRDVWQDDGQIKTSLAHPKVKPAAGVSVRRAWGIGTVPVIRFDDDDSDSYAEEEAY